MRGVDVNAGDGAADSGGGDVHAVGLAALDDFCVATDHGDACALESVGHGADFGFEDGTGEAFFENEGDDHRMGSGTGDGEVVHGSVDGEFADGAAGEAQGADDETVGGECDGGSADFDVCGVGESFG